MATQYAVRLLNFALRSNSVGAESRLMEVQRRFFSNNTHRMLWTTSFRRRSFLVTSFTSSRNQYENRHGSCGFTQPAIFMGIMAYFTGEQKEETLEEKVLDKIKRAILAIQRERYPKAEKYLDEAVNLCKDIPIAEEVKTQILDIRANMYLHTGELVQAEQAFKEVAQRLVNTGRVSASDNSIVEISIKLSEIYKLQNNLDQAEVGYKYCVDCQQAKIDKKQEKDDDTILLAAWALHGLGQIMIARAEASQNSKELITTAKQHIQKAYDMTIEVMGDTSAQAIAVRSDLATVEAMEGKVDEAVLMLEDLSDKSLEANDKNLYGTLRMNLGNLLLQTERFKDALTACREVQVLAALSNNSDLKKRSSNCILAAENGMTAKTRVSVAKSK